MAGGQGFTASQGSLGLTRSFVPDGAAFQAIAGTLTAVIGGGSNLTLALLGDHANFSTQAIYGSVTKASGQSITSGKGNVLFTGNDVTVNLNAGEETEAAFAAGSVIQGPAISGQAITSGIGTLTRSATQPISGSAMTAAIGIVSVNNDADDTWIPSHIGDVTWGMEFALTGEVITSSRGTISIEGSRAVDTAGEEDVFAAGTLGLDMSFELVGTAIALAQEPVGAPGYADLTGAEFTAVNGRVWLDDDRDYPIGGVADMTLSTGNMVTSSLAFVIGQEILMGQEQIGPRNLELVGMEIASGQYQFPISHDNWAGGHGRGHHGHAKKPGQVQTKRHHKTVIIDGQEFQVDSEEQLQQLVATAKEIAASEAARVVAEQVALKSKERIKLVIPKVSGNKELKEAITDIYTQATIDAEVSRNRQLDEEEALVLLLLS
jgi:hypothetical protein